MRRTTTSLSLTPLTLAVLAAVLAATPASGQTEAEIDALFDLDQHFRHVDTIFARVFGAPANGDAG